MLETLRAWLNGNREYHTGVAIYAMTGSNTALLSLFRKGKSDYNSKRLEEELLSICHSLKSKSDTNAATFQRTTTTIQTKITKLGTQSIATITKPNEKLYNACKKEADLIYKEAMNLRAELFAMGRSYGFEDVNRPDLVRQRSKMAIDVVVLFNKASKLYDRAVYVKQHGRLPDDTEDNNEENQYDDLPDHLVKKTLDNLRKNYNKIKKRPQTPERIELLQKHEKNIKKLTARWDLLNIQD